MFPPICNMVVKVLHLDFYSDEPKLDNTCFETWHNIRILEDHWSCSSPERLSHCKLMRFKLIENRPMKVYAWTLLTPGAWPNLTQGHDWHNL